MSPAAVLTPNYGGGDGVLSADYPRSGEEMAPTKMSAKDRV